MFDEWVEKVCWKGILDLQFIAPSNGQAMRIARTVMKALEVLLLDESSSECFCLMFLAFFSFPLLSNCCAFYAIHQFPSFLPFPRSSLAISSSPFLGLPIFPPCFTSSLRLPFHRVCIHSCIFRVVASIFHVSLFPPLPSIFFSRFRLITPFLSLFLFSLPSYLLPHFSTFGDFNPPSKTPFLPHLTRLDPTSRTPLLENSTHLGRQQLS